MTTNSDTGEIIEDVYVKDVSEEFGGMQILHTVNEKQIKVLAVKILLKITSLV